MEKITLFLKQHFFNLMSYLTIGFPFAAYKFLAGDAIRNIYKNKIGIILFYLFLVWAVIDLIFNLYDMIKVIQTKRKPKYVCILDYLAKKNEQTIKIKGIGEAIDLFLSFAIVGILVGWNLLSNLSPGYIIIWNIATAVNVLGSGIVRVAYVIVNNKTKGE